MPQFSPEVWSRLLSTDPDETIESMPTLNQARQPAPPRPTVEDEFISLAKEHPKTSWSTSPEASCHNRGTIDQKPLIEEADSSAFNLSAGSKISQEWRYVYVPRVASEEPRHGAHRRGNVKDARNRTSIISEKRLRSRSVNRSPSPSPKLNVETANIADRRTPSPYAYRRQESSRDSTNHRSVFTETHQSPVTYLSPVQPGTTNTLNGGNSATSKITTKKGNENAAESDHSDGQRRRRSGRFPYVHPGESKNEDTSESESLEGLRDQARKRSGCHTSPLSDDANGNETGNRSATHRSDYRSDRRTSRLSSSSHSRRDETDVAIQSSSAPELEVTPPKQRTGIDPASLQRSEMPDHRDFQASRMDSTILGTKGCREASRHLCDRSSGQTDLPDAETSYASSQPGLESFPWQDALPLANGPRSAPESRVGSRQNSRPPSRSGSNPLSRPESPRSPMRSSSPILGKPEIKGKVRDNSLPLTGAPLARPSSKTNSSWADADPRKTTSTTAKAATNQLRNERSSRVTPEVQTPIRPGPRIDVISPNSHHRPSYTRDIEQKPRHASPQRASTVPSQPATSPQIGRPAKVKALPECPRKSPVQGYTDWYTLKGCETFDLCPACFNSVIAPTRHHSYFIRAPSRDSNNEVMCDFSLPWIRMAWIMTRKKGKDDLDLVYAIARIAASIEPCPEASGAPRSWFTLIHPDSGVGIPNFDVCPCCVRSVETLLPSLKGAFLRARPDPQPKTCDLRFSSTRFLGYIDKLESTAGKAERSGTKLDLVPFANYARKRASMRECAKDTIIRGQAWHIMPQLPEFTVCEECFHDVVWPAIEKGSKLADLFSRRLQMVAAYDQGVTCQLYSPRMQRIFQDAVGRNDLEFLRRKVRERREIEAKVQARWAELSPYQQKLMLTHGQAGRGQSNAEVQSQLSEAARKLAKVTEEWRKFE
ncbi:MAG: hypothetical protein M1825_003286 [Sarcosagium campestre]|nr:MAG: hypothetical protein M1825_003286 [Sarcosagium campestre]